MNYRRNFRSDFENARRAALLGLSDPDEYAAPYVQLAIDRMSAAFDAAVHALEAGCQEAAPVAARPGETLLRASAVRLGNAQSGFQWCVLYVNGELVADPNNPPTVAEFTRRVVANGWKASAGTGQVPPGDQFTPDGQPSYELYFSRGEAVVEVAPRRVAAASRETALPRRMQ